MSLKTWNPNLMCYTGKWRLLRTVPDHLSWGNKKAKRFLELEVHPRKDLGKRLNLPGSITVSVRGVLAFEETPGTGAGKVPMHAPLGPPRFGWLGDPLHGVYGGEWQPCSRAGIGDHAPAPQARTATTDRWALRRFLRWHPSQMRCRTRSLSFLWWKGMLKNEALRTTPPI